MRTFRISRQLSVVFLAASLINFPPAAFAQEATQPGVPSKPRTLLELQERIAALLDESKFAAARWGVLIKADNGSVVFERDADKAFMPASNMKLYTSTAALDVLGPDFRIETRVYATRPVGRGGILRGDLVLVGRGDPNLSARFENDKGPSEFQAAETIPAIEALADQIKSRGIRRVVGDIVGDDSYFATDALGPGWEWDDAQFYYGAEISALTVNDNVVTFTVTPGARVGAPPLITVRPKTSYVSIINRATTSSQGRGRIGVNRPLQSNVVEFFGTIPRGGEKVEINIAIHNPPQFAAMLLREALVRRGVSVAGRIRRHDSINELSHPLNLPSLHEVAKIVSIPLSSMMKVINKPSQNLHTELMLRQLGAFGAARTLNEYGRPRPTDAVGNDVRRAFLQKAAADLQGLSLRDGSGLSRQDMVTPRATTRLLEYMKGHAHFQVFRDSLPVAGQDGTLERRMKGTSAAGNVRAKTGSLSYVSALSGYLQTKYSQLVVFSMMGNNYVGPARDVTQVLDQICVLLSEFEGSLP